MAAEANLENETWTAERLDGEWCVRMQGPRGWILVARGLTEERARLVAAAPTMRRALGLFECQWNACGPNSDFGRYFQNVRDAARAAIAKAEG